MLMFVAPQVRRKPARPIVKPKPSPEAMVLSAYLAAKLWDRKPFSQWPRAGGAA